MDSKNSNLKRKNTFNSNIKGKRNINKKSNSNSKWQFMTAKNKNTTDSYNQQ